MKPSRTLLAPALILLALTACALEPPVSVTQRESMLGQGVVIRVTNTSEKHLHDVVVDIESPDGETKRYAMATLEPHASENVGWLKLDGWPIPEGSEVTVSCKGYLTSSGPWKL